MRDPSPELQERGDRGTRQSPSSDNPPLTAERDACIS
jgi:hypothetical protein